MINTNKQILKEIFQLTDIIQRKWPELYTNIIETPLFINYEYTNLRSVDFSKYLHFLKCQIKVFNTEYGNGK